VKAAFAALAVVAVGAVAACGPPPCFDPTRNAVALAAADGSDDVAALPQSFAGALRAEPGGIWVDDFVARGPGCSDEWRPGPSAAIEPNLVQHFRALPGGGMFRAPSDAQPGDVFVKDVVCPNTDGIGDQHFIVAATPTRPAPVITAATSTKLSPAVATSCAPLGPFAVRSDHVTNTTIVDIDVTSDAPELRLDAWLLPAGAPLPAENVGRAAAGTPIKIDANHAVISISQDGSFALHLRFTDLQRGQTSNIFTAAVDVGDCSTTGVATTSTMLALALLLRARTSRRRALR
jgi:hypothetical protein